MKKYLFAAFLSLICSVASSAELKAPYRLVFSPHLPARMGAEDINSVQRGLMEAENYLLASVPGYFSDDSIPLASVRLGELALIWNPISYLEMVYQHEYFGHGARIRLFDNDHIIAVHGYTYNTPPPYGGGGAATNYYIDKNLITDYVLCATAAAGVNATGILGLTLQEKWLASEAIDGRDSLLYLRAYQNITDYVYDIRISSTEKSTSHSGHDMKDYLMYLKKIYNQNFTTKKLRRYAISTMIDPFTFYAAWSVYNYVVDGSPIAPPMIPIGSYRYLPTFRLMLAPYGPEIMMVNYFKQASGKWFSVNLRASSGFVPTNSYGVTVNFPKVYTKDKLSLGGSIDLWRQPKMSLTKQSNFNPKQTKMGGALQCEGSYHVYKNTSLYGLMGYKTNGYMPGEALNNRFFVQLGFEVEL